MDAPASLDVVEDVVRREFAAQQRRADAADTRAGLVLGFSGLVVSLGGDGGTALAVAAAVLAGAAALVALAATSVPVEPTTDVRELGERYLHVHPAVARLSLLGADIGLCEETRRRLDQKVARLRLASTLLTVAVAFAVLGGSVEAVT